MTSTTIDKNASAVAEEFITPPPRFALDPLRKRVSLRAIVQQEFDPTKKAHREAYAHFMENNKWPEGVRFMEEHPFTSAVTTAQHKLITWTLRKELSAVRSAKAVIKKAASHT